MVQSGEMDLGKPFNTEVNFFNRKIVEDNLPNHMYQKLKPVLNQYQDSTGKWQPIKGCNHIFMAHYKPDNNFSIHTDTGSYLEYENKIEKKSSHTLLIYLNDDYIGGRLVFIINLSNMCFRSNRKKAKQYYSIFCYGTLEITL